MEMQIQTRRTLATMDDRFFYCGAGVAIQHMPIDDIAGLLEEAETADFTHVWIVPATELSAMFKEPVKRLEGWDIVSIPGYLSARREGARYEDSIQIGFTEWSRWPWKVSSSTAKGLLQTITYLENALQMPVEWTPAHMAMAYVRRENEKRWSWLSPMTLDLEEKGFSYADDIARELHWPPKGIAPIATPGATHEISIDGNSAYASGMTGLNIGEGNPVWTDDFLEIILIYDGKTPGIWRLSSCEKIESIFDGVSLPEFKLQWATTDMIEQLRKSGYGIGIEAGWHWGSEPGKKPGKKPRYHQMLRSTAEKLWKLRVEWRAAAGKSPAHESGHESLRAIIKAIHGRFGRPKNTDPHEKRRDIWAFVVARSVAMTAYRIEKIYKLYGILPKKIKADELRYDVSDPHIFDSMLDIDKLGGFKLVDCVEIAK